MSDLMLKAVLRMPYEMAMADELSRRQFYDRAQQALNLAESLQAHDDEVIEKCAKVCDGKLGGAHKEHEWWYGFKAGMKQASDAIRALKEVK